MKLFIVFHWIYFYLILNNFLKILFCLDLGPETEGSQGTEGTQEEENCFPQREQAFSQQPVNAPGASPPALGASDLLHRASLVPPVLKFSCENKA